MRRVVGLELACKNIWSLAVEMGVGWIFDVVLALCVGLDWAGR